MEIEMRKSGVIHMEFLSSTRVLSLSRNSSRLRRRRVQTYTFLKEETGGIS